MNHSPGSQRCWSSRVVASTIEASRRTMAESAAARDSQVAIDIAPMPHCNDHNPNDDIVDLVRDSVDSHADAIRVGGSFELFAAMRSRIGFQGFDGVDEPLSCGLRNRAEGSARASSDNDLIDHFCRLNSAFTSSHAKNPSVCASRSAASISARSCWSSMATSNSRSSIETIAATGLPSRVTIIRRPFSWTRHINTSAFCLSSSHVADSIDSLVMSTLSVSSCEPIAAADQPMQTILRRDLDDRRPARSFAGHLRLGGTGRESGIERPSPGDLAGVVGNLRIEAGHIHWGVVG